MYNVVGNLVSNKIADHIPHGAYCILFLKMAKKNSDWTGTRTRDLWITVLAFSHLSYPALWMVPVPSGHLLGSRVGQPDSLDW